MELSEVKSTLNTIVTYNSTRYILKGCTIRRNEKTQQIFYQAELADMKASSVLIVRLDDVIVLRTDVLQQNL